MQDINLLPQSEITEQTKEKVISLSTIVSVIFLLGFICFSGYILYLENKAKVQIKELDSKIEVARQQIIAKSDIEVMVRNLDKKYSALQNIFSNTKRYSLLMTEVRVRKPSTLQLVNVDVKEGSIGVNGIADNYVSIADYINNLLNKKFEGGTKGLEELFTSVSINSVDMESTKNSIQFFIVVGFDPSKLK